MRIYFKMKGKYYMIHSKNIFDITFMQQSSQTILHNKFHNNFSHVASWILLRCDWSIRWSVTWRHFRDVLSHCSDKRVFMFKLYKKITARRDQDLSDGNRIVICENICDWIEELREREYEKCIYIDSIKKVASSWSNTVRIVHTKCQNQWKHHKKCPRVCK